MRRNHLCYDHCVYIYFYNIILYADIRNLQFNIYDQIVVWLNGRLTCRL